MRGRGRGREWNVFRDRGGSSERVGVGIKAGVRGGFTNGFRGRVGAPACLGARVWAGVLAGALASGGVGTWQRQEKCSTFGTENGSSRYGRGPRSD